MLKEKIEWQAPEYEHDPKDVDWFWALGIIFVCGVVISIIYKNYSFAVFLFIAGILMGLFAKKAPGDVLHILDSRGLTLKDRLYPYKSIQAFWVQEKTKKEESRPLLFIHTERLFIPIISFPIPKEEIENIREIMLANDVKETEMHEYPSVAIFKFFGF